MARENKSRYALLGILSFHPMSGYDLKKQIEQTTNHFWHEDFAQIYPILKQLEAEGLTTSTVEKQEGRPERHIYALTEKGWGALRNWIAKPVSSQVRRNELLLKLFFADHVPVAVSIEHVQQFREFQLVLQEAFQRLKDSITQQHPVSKQSTYWLLTVNYGACVSQALINWCDDTLAQLGQLDDTTT